MRALISLVLSLLLVGIGYGVYSHFFERPEPAEMAESPGGAKTPAPPPKSVEAPPPEKPPDTVPPSMPIAPPTIPHAAGWSSVEKQILELTNAARAEAHVAPLQPEDGLRQCALAQSADMLDRNFFDHVNPSGEDPSDRMSRIDRQLVGTSGENIWKGAGNSYAANPNLARIVMDGWMHSSGHRANILRPQFTHLGVGVVIRGDEVRATQSFSRVRAYLSAALPETLVFGSPLELSTTGDPPAAELYTLDRLGGGSGPGTTDKPQPVSGTSVRAAPGKYVLQLYFKTGSDAFAVFRGPSLQVTNH